MASFSCQGCGAAVAYMRGQLVDATSELPHSCGRGDPPPIDWHECRWCPAAIFELFGAYYDDPYGKQQHVCAPLPVDEPAPAPESVPPAAARAVVQPPPPLDAGFAPRAASGRASRQQLDAIRKLRSQLGIAGSSDIPSTVSSKLAAEMIEHLQEQLQSPEPQTKVFQHG